MITITITLGQTPEGTNHCAGYYDEPEGSAELLRLHGRAIFRTISDAMRRIVESQGGTFTEREERIPHANGLESLP